MVTLNTLQHDIIVSVLVTLNTHIAYVKQTHIATMSEPHCHIAKMQRHGPCVDSKFNT